MPYHHVVHKIIELLNKSGYWYQTFKHEPVRTSEQAAKTRPGFTISQGAKAIIVRVKKSGGEKFFIMLVLPADKRIDFDKVKDLLEVKDIRFAGDDEISKITSGVEPGGIPPLGNLFDLKVIADPHLFENEKIVFNAGDRRFSLAVKSADYHKLVSPRISSII